MERWRFGSESWKQFEMRVATELRKRLKSYRESAERVALQSGHLPTVRKRSGSTDTPQMHYEWLALRVCKRATYGQIADPYSGSFPDGLTDDAVRKAISRTAKSIGLSLTDRT